MNVIQMSLPLPQGARPQLPCSTPRAENELHHLSCDKKGWLLRITVTAMNRHGIVSKRLRIRLGKGTEREAVIRRDASIKALKAVGLRVSQRNLVRGCRRDP